MRVQCERRDTQNWQLAIHPSWVPSVDERAGFLRKYHMGKGCGSSSIVRLGRKSSKRVQDGEASCNFLISRYPVDFITATSGISSGFRSI
ncbi:MAG: hypothetical protein JWO19_191 [Bryobacterales bacterium]|nr:hypothetical protein [Bryobacterales bacterium]